MRVNEEGFSLVELMLATAILGILTFMIASYQLRSATDSEIIAAKQEGDAELTNVLTLLRKNSKTKAAGHDFNIIPNGLDFVQAQRDGSLTKIQITSRCRPHNSPASKLVSVDPWNRKCWDTLACKGSPYIEVRKTDSSGQVNLQEIPALSQHAQSMKKKVAFDGLGLCVNRTAQGISIRGIETIRSRLNAEISVTLHGMGFQMLESLRNDIELIH